MSRHDDLFSDDGTEVDLAMIDPSYIIWVEGVDMILEFSIDMRDMDRIDHSFILDFGLEIVEVDTHTIVEGSDLEGEYERLPKSDILEVSVKYFSRKGE